ncbi:MAG: site-2 protease family protein [Deltaproteobacteria bacterium]|nr:site-2 protease family protein [Deltaproteobacteria bacterium]
MDAYIIIAYIIIILLTGLSLLIHEIGHLAAAKFFDIKVKLFSIGICPSLASYNYKDIKVKICAFPVMFYVTLNYDTNSYFNIPLYKRVLFSIFGSLANLLFLIFIYLFCIAINKTFLVSEFYKIYTLMYNINYIPGILYLINGFAKLIYQNLYSCISFLLIINIIITAVNLLPIIEHDGGKIIFNILNQKKPNILKYYVAFSKILKFSIGSLVIYFTIMDSWRLFIKFFRNTL